MTDRTDLALSCVIDDSPAIWASVVPWLATAIDLLHVRPAQLHIHHVCDLRPDIGEICSALGVNTHRIEPFDLRYPHTNKIQQCRTVFAGARRVILTDADIVFAGALPLDSIGTLVAGKPVDLPNPPLEILGDVFSAAGLPFPPICRNAFFDAEGVQTPFDTAVGNFNGGVYVLDRGLLPLIGEAWARWARWLIAHIKLIGNWSAHVDQVSFCLAVQQLQLPVGLLGNAWNFPLHINMDPRIDPYIVHHHALFDARWRLKPALTSRANNAITRINQTIASFQRRHLFQSPWDSSRTILA